MIQRVTKSSADRPGKFSKSKQILQRENYFKRTSGSDRQISTIKTNKQLLLISSCFMKMLLL